MNIMKKIVKFLTIPVVALTPTFFTISCGHSPKKDPEIKEVVLTRKQVMSNFEQGGIWENKTFLTKEDLSEFNVLGRGCFNFLTRELEYIEIPKFMKTDDYKIFNNEKIKEIRVAWDSKYFYIKNDLLVYEDDNGYDIILTIANRKKQIETLEINSDQTESYNIVDNFYYTNEKLFENVKKIKIWAYIDRIGENAFKNCQKIEEVLLKKNSEITIMNSAFENSSIKVLKIGSEETLIIWLTRDVKIGQNTFKNCYQLNRVFICTLNLFINEEAFSLDKKIKTREYEIRLEIHFIEQIKKQEFEFKYNAFKGEYDLFSFAIYSWMPNPEIEYNPELEWGLGQSNQAFSNIITESIDNFVFIFGPFIKNEKNFFTNQGLTEEQYNKIIKY